MEKDLFQPPIPLNGYGSYQEMLDAACSKNENEKKEFWRDVAVQLLDWENDNFTNIIGEIGNSNSFWYDGGELNVCYNCVDRHAKENPEKIALIYEGNELNEGYKMTYGELLVKVSKTANILKSYGVRKGDVVVIYLPVCCESVITMLACARIGAIHSLIFGAFRGDALQYRILDCKPKVIVTANGYKRATKTIPMKKALDEIIDKCDSVEHIIVVKLIDLDVNMNEKDSDFDELLKNASDECMCVPINSKDPLFYLYTSGSTGNPKGIIHRAGGYAVAAALSHRFVFSIKKDDIFGCTSDFGWITGHTYACYGPLLNGITTLVFGGLPLYPDETRSWKMINSLKLTHFYTSPSAARAISARINYDKVKNIDISTLRVIGSVGETLDDTTWNFLYKTLGKEKCSIVDTYWQTEMGSIIATSIPGHHEMKPGYIGQPLFGLELVLLDTKDYHLKGISSNLKGPINDALLCIASPWPGLANDCLTGKEMFQKTYLIPGTNYFSTGDIGSITSDGYIKIIGRNDDQLCVNGHRVGPAEVESAIMEHPKVVEAAVVGIPHPLSGQTIVAFVVSKYKTDQMKKEVQEAVFSKFGAIGRPSSVYIVDDLPKTRSEKIIRMILRGILLNEKLNIPPTIKNPEVIQHLKDIVSNKN